MLTDHGLRTSLLGGFKNRKEQELGDMAEKSRASDFSGRLFGANKARVAPDSGAQRVEAGTLQRRLPT